MSKLSPIARVTQGALVTYLTPRIAQDQALPALAPMLQDITGKNFGTMTGTIARRVKTATRGKLAQDANIEDLTDLLDALEDTREREGEDLEEEDDPNKPVVELDEDPEEELDETHAEEDEAWDRRADDARRRLGRDETDEEREKREDEQGAEDMRRHMGRDENEEECQDRMRHMRVGRDRRRARDRKRADDAKRKLGRDETPEECQDRMHRMRARDRKRADDAMRKRADDRRHMGRDEPNPFSGMPRTGGKMEPISKETMDKAIKAAADAAIKQQRSVADAERFIRPWVGDLEPSLAFDSAGAVVHHALKMRGVKAEANWPEAALRSLLEAQPRAGAQPRARLAQDTAGGDVKSFEEMFPSAARIRVVA